MKSFRRFFLLIGIVILFFCVSLFGRNETFTLLLPLQDLMQTSSLDREKILSMPILVGVHTKEDLDTARTWGLHDQQIVVYVDTEIPAWYESRYSLIFSNRKNKQLELPAGSPLISEGLNLALELVPSTGLSPVDIFGSRALWVHRIFKEEIPSLSLEDRWNRYRRALRERSVLILEFYSLGSESYYQQICSFLDFLGERWSLGLNLQSNQISAGFLESKILKAALITVLAITYGSPFLIFLPLLFLPGTLGIQASGFLFSVVTPLILYHQLQKENSPGGTLFMPLRVFFHSLIVGGFYSLLMLDHDLKMRVLMPLGISLSLLIPVILVVIHELIGLISGTILRPASESRRVMIAAGLIAISYVVLVTMMYRSSNYSGFPVWDWEVQMRLWFEENLYARPRMREILGYIGLVFLVIDTRHPNTVLRFLGRLSLIILIVSIMNTYSHLHTEFWFRVLRQSHSFWIGFSIFILLGYLVCRLSRKRGVLRLGYFGFGNLGDDLLAYASIDPIKSQSNYFIVARHTGLNLPGEILRNDWLRILDRVMTVETFVLGPGGILQDKTSFKSILYYLGFSLASKFFGARVEWMGQGVSPLKYAISRKIIGFCARFTDRIDVRDLESRQVLLSCGIPQNTIFVSRDLVFNLGFRVSQVRKNSLGIILRSWKGFPLKRVLQFLATIKLRKTYYLFQEDEKLALEVLEQDPGSQILIYQSEISDFIKSLTESEKIISMRYHGLVLALQSSRLVFPIAYDEKCMNLVREKGIQHFVEESEWHLQDEFEGRLKAFLA